MHLHTSVTDLQVAALPGDMTLNSDDLRVTEAKGQVHVITHSKDVDLSQIYGDSYVEDRDGRSRLSRPAYTRWTRRTARATWR